MEYRKDIDGLRSLAIIPVVLFHAGFDFLSGGYVGVDIFFVISGFLITSVIIRGLETGKFSFTHFYERRARRLLPALFAVLTFSLIAGFFIMSPIQYRDMGTAIIATVFYLANFLMWSRSGYFQSSSEYDPMLHMWSLSVEEQFYIFYPILLLVIVRNLKRNPLTTIILISAASFALAVWGVLNMPNPTFFWLPTRAWELGLGAVVALSSIGANWTSITRHSIGLVGLIFILFAIIFYDPLTPFPGLAALPPVMGTAMIIAAGRGGKHIVGNLLSMPPLVGIGLVSYSLYLWHWPVLVFLNIHFGLHQVPVLALTSGVVISVILAYFSWRFIEQPFRSSSGFNRKQIFTFSGAGITAATLAGFALWSAQGFDTRFDDDTNAAFQSAEENPYLKRCMGLRNPDALCTLGSNNASASFILWGDSHAMSAAQGFDTAAKNQNKRGLLASHSDCPPALGLTGSPLHNGASCEKFRDIMLSYIESDPTITNVILHARWARYSEPGLDWEVGAPPSFKLINSDLQPFNGESYSRNYLDEGLLALIKRLKQSGKIVHLVEGVPEQSFEVAYAVGRHLGFDAELPPAMATDHALHRERIFDRIGNALDEAGVHRQTISSKFCSDECIYLLEKTPLYQDDNHLSLSGSVFAFSDFDFEVAP